MRPHHRQRRTEAPPGQRLDLVESARADHGIEARLDAVSQPVPIGCEEEPQAAPARQERRAMRIGLPGGQRAAGGGVNFERPQDPLAVRGSQSRRHEGIGLGKPGMEGGRGVGLGGKPNLVADPVRHWRHDRKTRFQSLEI